jgi:type VI secretion system protein ImpL
MRWVLLVLLVLALAAAWAAVYFFPEALWIAVAITIVAVAIVVVVVVVRWQRARAKAAALDPAAAAAKQAELQKEAERRAIRADLRSAIAALRRGGRSVARLPWLALVGTSGSGKTTFVERSGLAFTPADLAAPKAHASARPRVFEWWWSPDAMVLEAGGKLADDEGSREKWVALLDGLVSLRPDRPLDGLVVAVSIADLAGLDDVGLQRLAAGLRRRVDEALQRLEMVLPVYLVLTKADLIGGFVEFWSASTSASARTREDLSAVWGASFAAGEPRLREPARAVEAELEVLADRIHTLVLDRIPAERDPGRRERLMQFPLEFRKVSAPLVPFVEALLRSGADDESLVFRGFYLTGATQSTGAAHPLRRGQGQGVVPPGSPAAGSAMPGGSGAESRSYFSRDIFGSVIVPDRSLATRSPAGTRRRMRREMRAGLGALAIALLVLVPAIVSYVHNAELAGEVDAAVRALAGADATSVPGAAGDPIEQLLDVVERLDREASGLGIPGWFGPRVARELLVPSRRLYVSRLHAWLLRRLRPDLDRQLEMIAGAHALADAPLTDDDMTPLRESYETVKLCATLVDPKGHVDASVTPQRLAQAWRGLLPDTGVVPNERLMKHAANYLAALEQDPSLAWPAPRSLPGARERLKRYDIRGLPYRRLLLWAKDEPPIRASDVFGGASLEFLDCRGDVQIAGAYTANGWSKIREGLRSPQPWPPGAVVERWVVGDASLPADERALRDQVRAQYFEDYTRRWTAFLDELRVKTPSNAAAARAELGAFKEADGFYGALFHQFKLNAIHDEEPATLAATVSGLASKLPWAKADGDASAKSAPPSPVEKSFRPLLLFSGEVAGDRPTDGPPPLEKYRLILTKLKAALDAPSDQPNPDAQTQFSEASNGVAALLDAVEEPTRGRLWRLLMPPVKGGVQAAKVEGVGSLSDDWKSSVWTAWDEKLSGRFPFRKSPGGGAANFADFAAFFKPKDGLLWGFVHSKLVNWVEPSGSGAYVAKRGADPLAPELLECLTVAQEISEVFFREGDDVGLKLSFLADWSAPDVTTAKIWVGAKETALPRAQWSAPVKWFGEDAKLEWVQGGRPTQELGRHAFSLFDLFDQLGGLRPAGARGVYLAEFPPLSLKVRAEGRADALKPDFFARLRCPREIDMAKR